MPKHNQPECRAQANAVPALRSSEFLEHAMRTWGDMVLRLALSQLRNATDAEDVFQDAFLRLLKNTTPFNDDEHVKAWLLRVTINRCRDVGRSRSKRRNEPLTDVHASIEADAARTAAQRSEWKTHKPHVTHHNKQVTHEQLGTQQRRPPPMLHNAHALCTRERRNNRHGSSSPWPPDLPHWRW